MRTTGIGGRIDRLERDFGEPERDARHLVEILEALANGTETPHVVTAAMREIVARELLAIDAEAAGVATPYFATLQQSPR